MVTLRKIGQYCPKPACILFVFILKNKNKTGTEKDFTKNKKLRYLIHQNIIEQIPFYVDIYFIL